MKLGRIGRILAAALVVSFIGGLLPATAALAAPTVTVYPLQGKVGDSITVTGTGFSANATLNIFLSPNPANIDISRIGVEVTTYGLVQQLILTSGNTGFTTAFFIPTSLTGGTVQDSVRSGTYYVYVTSTNDTSQYVRAYAGLTIVAGVITLSPTSGTFGSEVRITGSGYGTSESISIQYDGAAIDIKSGDRTTSSTGGFSSVIAIPESTGGEHVIRAIGGLSTVRGEAMLTVLGKVSVSPAAGPVGTTLNVSGSGFAGNTNVNVSFDDYQMVTATASPKGSFTTSFLITASAGGPHRIRASDGVNVDTQTFTVQSTIRIGQTSGYVGDKVNAKGAGFLAMTNVNITFDNSNVLSTMTDTNGSFNVNITIPSKGAGTYKIKASDGTNTSEGDFAILSSASISPVTSTDLPGNVGTQLTVSGIGFLAGKTVTVTYDGKSAGGATVQGDGTFAVSFAAPASKAGQHNIVATDGTNTKQLVFFMESTPPLIPQPSLPAEGVKSEAMTVFDWADVTDPSGVTYTLQVADKADFSAGSVLLEKTGLTTSGYTLVESEKLESRGKNNPYYWRVRAIDGAGNESAWAPAVSFYVGFTFGVTQLIYVILGIFAVILGLIGYLIGRRGGRTAAEKEREI